MKKHKNKFIRLAKDHQDQGPIGRVALSWITKNLNGVPVEILKKLPEQQMARTDLRNYCRDEGNPVEACFLTIMAWGGMRTNHLRRVWLKRGEWQATLKQLRNTPSISRQDAFRLLSRLRADGCLPGMRAAFFTKLIFFLRYEADGYIMDQWTAKSINLIEGRDVVPIDRTGLVPDRVSDYNYEDFCQCIEKIGVEINKSPDKVEEMLMSRGGLKAEPWREYVKMYYCR